jgi:hypothetical protein
MAWLRPGRHRSSVGGMTSDAQIYPFRIEIPQADLDDLPAMEEPDLLIADIRQFFRQLREEGQ